MSFLANVVIPYPDELLYSWIHRLAEANGLNIVTFSNHYLGVKKAHLGKLKLDVRGEFLKLCRYFIYDVDICSLYNSLCIFSFEALSMTKEHQTRYINNVFRERDKLNTSVNYLFYDAYICPECLKEDIIKYGEPYLHRAHHLSKVYYCNKHKCRLLLYKGKHGHECEYNLDDYHEIEKEYDSTEYLEYTKYAVRLFETGLCSDIKNIKKVMFERLKELKYFPNDHYALLISDIHKWEYKNLISFDVENFLSIKMISANNIKIDELLPIIMYLFPDPDLFIHKLNSNVKLIEQFHCKVCGKEYYATPNADVNGWGCPYCDIHKSEIQRFEKLVKISGGGEYTVLNDFVSLDKNLIMYHTKCKNSFSVKPRSFLFEGVRCNCECTISEQTAKSKIECNKGFKLIKYNGTNSSVKIYHESCGEVFYCNYHKFINYPGCRFCKPPYMTDDLYKKRVEELVGDEYTIVKGFVNQKEKVIIKHNICGVVQAFKPSAFLDGQRCKICKKTITEKMLRQMIYEYGGRRYNLKEYSSNYCVIEDSNDNSEKRITKSKLIQEITRPTPSDILPVDKKKRVEVPMSQWEMGYKLLFDYKNEFGNTNVPKRKVYKNYNLGTWVQHQRYNYKMGRIKGKRKELLDKLGFRWGGDE